MKYLKRTRPGSPTQLVAVALLVIAFGHTATTAKADFAAGVVAYEKADFITALKEWTAAAETGDAKAQYNLGVLHDEGKGVDLDHSAAVKWWSMAAKNGLAVAQHNLASAYIAGDGVKKNHRKAGCWL